ncbi:MAG: hypothetical protein HC808_16470 [Candidatus Competibacteraceae bacterium]|nr:hypothetical protein [Candidatus Competibacteraceae bacterium]
MVEDLANKPDLSPADVSKRLNKLSEQAEAMQKLDPRLSKEDMAERFAKNFNESLQAVTQHNPSALNRVVNAFGQGGKLQDIKNEYTFYNDPDKAGLEAADRHEQSKPADIYSKMGRKPPMTARDYVNSGIVDPEEWSDAKQDQHAFGQMLIGKLSSTVNDPAGIRGQVTNSQKTALKEALGNGKAFKGGDMAVDFKGNDDVDRQLQQSINQRGMQTVGNNDFSEDFIKDNDRATMLLIDGQGQQTNIRQEMKDAKIDPNTTDGKKAANKMSTDHLLNFAGGLGFTGQQQSIAAKNLSKLMNQQVVGSLDAPAQVAFGKDFGSVLGNQGESLTFAVAAQKNGDVIVLASKQSNINAVSTPPQNKRDLDPNKNNMEEVVKLRIRREDLAKEPLQFEVLEANANYNLDIPAKSQ